MYKLNTGCVQVEHKLCTSRTQVVCVSKVNKHELEITLCDNVNGLFHFSPPLRSYPPLLFCTLFVFGGHVWGLHVLPHVVHQPVPPHLQ